MKFSRTIMLPIAGLAVLAALSGCGANNNPLGLNQTDTTPPPAPTNLGARYVGGQPVLTWDASAAPDVVGYQVEVFNAGGNDYVQANDPNTSDAIFQLPTVNVSTQQVYRVRAVDASGNWSAFSSPAQVTLSGQSGGAIGIE